MLYDIKQGKMKDVLTLCALLGYLINNKEVFRLVRKL